MKASLAPTLFVALLGCSPAPPAGSPAGGTMAPGPHAFDVQLTFTPRAAERLKGSNERVIVAGMYWGVPKAGAQASEDEMGQVQLGEDFVEVAPENAIIKVPAVNFESGQLTNVEGAPQVLVNVYSARRTHENNLLDCGIYEGPVSMAQQQPVDIQCDLID